MSWQLSVGKAARAAASHHHQCSGDSVPIAKLHSPKNDTSKMQDMFFIAVIKAKYRDKPMKEDEVQKAALELKERIDKVEVPIPAWYKQAERCGNFGFMLKTAFLIRQTIVVYVVEPHNPKGIFISEVATANGEFIRYFCGEENAFNPMHKVEESKDLFISRTSRMEFSVYTLLKG